MSRLASKIEAILYLKAQPLKIAQIAEFAQCDRDTAEEGLISLMGEYAHREGALEIAETEEGYALRLRELFKPLVDTIVPLDIGLGALRTLAAIALRGPIAQSELVEVRGSGVYQHVPDLVEQGFVKKRRQADGRSSWLQVTEKFYQHFEIDKLPQIESLRLPKQKNLPLDTPDESAPDRDPLAETNFRSTSDEAAPEGTLERSSESTAGPSEADVPEAQQTVEGLASDEVVDQLIAEKAVLSETSSETFLSAEVAASEPDEA